MLNNCDKLKPERLRRSLYWSSKKTGSSFYYFDLDFSMYVDPFADSGAIHKHRKAPRLFYVAGSRIDPDSHREPASCYYFKIKKPLESGFKSSGEQDRTADLRVMNGEIYAIQALC